MINETAAIRLVENVSRRRGEVFTSAQEIAIAQVYATLALADELKEVHDVLKGIEDSLDAITAKMR